MKITRPENIHPDFYFLRYIKQVEGEDALQALVQSEKESLDLYATLSEEQANFRYAEGKWSVKQVLRHIADCERILSYRALCFSRGDTTNLAGFDEDFYADNDNSDYLTMAQIIQEFRAIRHASILLFETLNSEKLDFEGSASGLDISARTLAWTIAGHNVHHLNVLKERYF